MDLGCLVPDVVLGSVLEVTPAWLGGRGLRGLILDLDNTLVPYGQRSPDPAVMRHITAIRGAGTPAIILSNARSGRAARIATELDLPFIANAGKPRAASFERALQLLELAAAQVAAVGDQLFRDVLGAKKAGCLAVYVRPLSPRDFPGTKLLRWPEALLIAHLQRRGRWPTGV